MPAAKVRASTILGEFEKAQTELVGKAVILTDGKAGTVEGVWLDEMHGLRNLYPRPRWEMAHLDHQARPGGMRRHNAENDRLVDCSRVALATSPPFLFQE